MGTLEVLDEGTEVVPVPLRVRNLDESFDSVSTRRRPTRVDEVIRRKSPLGCLNVNMIKVENNKPRMLKQSIVSPRRKLPAETYNRELLLFGFVCVWSWI